MTALPDDDGAKISANDGRPRSWTKALARGWRGKCPQCGKHALFKGYVRAHETCGNCGLELSGHRADDAPPYVTIMIVGHIAIPLALGAKQILDPPLALQFAVWGPLMLIATAYLLPAVKGGLIGLQWANRMHGFSDDQEEDH